MQQLLFTMGDHSSDNVFFPLCVHAIQFVYELLYYNEGNEDCSGSSSAATPR